MPTEERPEIEVPPTVLIVEPDQGFSDALADGFTRAGFIVRQVTEGPEAMQAAEHDLPDLVVLDAHVTMGPPPLLLEALRHHPATRALPLVALTPLTFGDAAEAIHSGADDCLIKPVTPDEVLAASLTVLDRATAWRGEREAVQPA